MVITKRKNYTMTMFVLLIFMCSTCHYSLSTARRHKTKSILETMRGGRHENYASIVFQFSNPIDFDVPTIKKNEINFTLKNIINNLAPFRKYKTFNSWVLLKKVGNDVNVTIGFPDDFFKLRAFFLKNPYRLVIHLYYKKDIPLNPEDKIIYEEGLQLN